MTPSAEAPGAGRLPDFFVGGHAKSGTTALYEMLRRHPQIFMSELKEPLYFATDLRLRFQRPAAGPLPTELSEYLPLFADAAPGQLVGEASSSYLWSAEAAANIAALRPDAKFIFILREPAAFLRSLHLQLLQNHIESEKDLRRALALEEQRRQGKRIPRRSTRPQALLYSDRVRYVEQLERYRVHFPEQQLLVLIYDDFRRENEATVRRVLRFLEVDDSVGVAPTEANPTVRMRSQQLDELVNAVSVGRGPATRAVKGLIKAVTPSRLRERALQATLERVVLGDVGAPEPAVMSEIRLRFRHEVVALSDYMNRDLVSEWGYDGLE
jgi:hypothetical protein